MKIRMLGTLSVFLLSASLVLGAEATHKVSQVKKAPEGLGDSISEKLSPAGYRIEGPEGPVVDLWLVKELSVKEDFAPGLGVKYPLSKGHLVGAVRVPEGSEFTDFRGQEISPGVYTLRYAQQPVDGNHIGTSETADFLLASPAKEDTEAKPITSAEQLSQQSAKSAGSNHPAIYSLLPAEEKPDGPKLTHDEDHDFWILSVTGEGKKGDKAVELPIRLVVVGRTFE